MGWTLVYPDYEGPYAEYAAPHMAGYITLDAIRAAEQFTPLGLSATTPVAWTGYSGGAIASAWAASLQQSYAPGLKVVGIASGGTPANYPQIFSNIDTNTVANAAFFSIIFMAAVGQNRAYPALLTPYLNAAGVAAATSMENGCVGKTSSGGSGPSGTFPTYTTLASPNPAENAILNSESLPAAGLNPSQPDIFVYHSMNDELIPIAGTTTMVNAWCAGGSHVDYYIGNGDHVSFEGTMISLVYTYLQGRFSGTTLEPPGTTTCN